MKTIKKNNEAINVYLPNKLFKNLKEAIEERQARGEEPKLQLAQAAYFANLVVYLPFTKKDQEDKYGWVSLCSEILNTIGNYSDYMDFLVKSEILERHPKNYSTKSGKCYRYRLAEPYRNHVITMKEVKAHKSFIKARNSEFEERKRKAEESTPHLTKWLDPNKFHVDYEAAMAYIREEYQGETMLGKKNKRIIAVESLKAKDWGFSREGKDDRLHSLLTRLPKDLKKFVTYSDFGPIRSLDIKSSQPFIFTSIIQNKYIDKTVFTQNITKHLYQYKCIIPSTMLDENGQGINVGALQGFIYEVLCGKFYENYGQILYEEGVLMKKVDHSFYYHGTTEQGKVMIDYETLRDAGKNLIMRTFFSSYVNRHNYIRVFEKHYPEPFAVMQKFKKSKPDEKNYFPLLLQNIEADFMLNYATKLIAEKHPEIPLFTIHDSIITTEENIALVEEEFRKHLLDYFGLTPQLSRESWCKDCEAAA